MGEFLEWGSDGGGIHDEKEVTVTGKSVSGDIVDPVGGLEQGGVLGKE